MVQKHVRYLEPFLRVTHECDRRTDIIVANAALHCVARPKTTCSYSASANLRHMCKQTARRT